MAALEDALSRLREANPGIAVTFTVSPVRHLRNAHGPGEQQGGLVELDGRRGHACAVVEHHINPRWRHHTRLACPVANARSKAHLLAAVHELIDRRGHASELPPLDYFPAFEIMMDDLRDYRFYDAGKSHN